MEASGADVVHKMKLTSAAPSLSMNSMIPTGGANNIRELLTPKGLQADVTAALYTEGPSLAHQIESVDDASAAHAAPAEAALVLYG